MIRCALVLMLMLLAPACRGTSSTDREAHAATAVDGGVVVAPRPGAAPAPCDEPDAEPEANTTATRGGDQLSLTRAQFADLPGWADDAHAEAVPAFLASCAKLAELEPRRKIGYGAFAGRARDWRAACAAAARVPAGDDRAARRFFEVEFRVYAASGTDGPKAKFTGYYVQSLRGSLTRGGRYRTPIMARPADLAEVQLSSFIRDGRGRRIWGKLDPSTGKLAPYPTRPEMRRAGFDKKHALLWVDDPVDAVFAEIQGSGRVTMGDDSEVWIAFDGKNGRRFRGVGGILRRMGELDRGQATMQGTRAWFEANPSRFHEIADRNPAKVFFKVSDRAGAIGTQDVILTPRRSIAVDRAVIALSTPIWVDARAPVSAKSRTIGSWRHLLIAQDTGGAIVGPTRGDIYWGDDRDAGEIAGRMGGSGRMWLLLPRKLRVAAGK